MKFFKIFRLHHFALIAIRSFFFTIKLKRCDGMCLILREYFCAASFSHLLLRSFVVLPREADFFLYFILTVCMHNKTACVRECDCCCRCKLKFAFSKSNLTFPSNKNKKLYVLKRFACYTKSIGFGFPALLHSSREELM